MATSLLKSFIEVVNPPVGKVAKKVCDPQGHKTKRKMWPRAAQDPPSTEPSSKGVLESWSSQPEKVVDQGAVQEWVEEGEDVLEVSWEEFPSLELVDQIAIHRQIPVTDPDSMLVNTSSEPILASTQQLQWEAEDRESEVGDIIQDAQFFPDASTEYQMAYQSLDEKYTHQAVLVNKASEALKASESCVSVLQEELIALKHWCEADIHKAVGQAVSQYKQQLTTPQSPTRKHQSAITQLQGQVQALQISLASQKDLPSVGATQEEVDLREEVFNFVLGTVNTNRGTVVYSSPDQPFSSKNRSDSGTGHTSLIWGQMLLVLVFLYQVTCHHTHQHLSMDLVRCS